MDSFLKIFSSIFYLSRISLKKLCFKNKKYANFVIKIISKHYICKTCNKIVDMKIFMFGYDDNPANKLKFFVHNIIS